MMATTLRIVAWLEFACSLAVAFLYLKDSQENLAIITLSVGIGSALFFGALASGLTMLESIQNNTRPDANGVPPGRKEPSLTQKSSGSFFRAIRDGDEEAVYQFLETGFRGGFTRSSDGVSALHVAAKYGQVDVARMLIAAGADVDATDGNGRTPLDVADDGSMKDMLLQNKKE